MQQSPPADTNSEQEAKWQSRLQHMHDWSHSIYKYLINCPHLYRLFWTSWFTWIIPFFSSIYSWYFCSLDWSHRQKYHAQITLPSWFITRCHLNSNIYLSDEVGERSIESSHSTLQSSTRFILLFIIYYLII